MKTKHKKSSKPQSPKTTGNSEPFPHDASQPHLNCSHPEGANRSKKKSQVNSQVESPSDQGCGVSMEECEFSGFEELRAELERVLTTPFEDYDDGGLAQVHQNVQLLAARFTGVSNLLAAADARLDFFALLIGATLFQRLVARSQQDLQWLESEVLSRMPCGMWQTGPSMLCQRLTFKRFEGVTDLQRFGPPERTPARNPDGSWPEEL